MRAATERDLPTSGRRVWLRRRLDAMRGSGLARANQVIFPAAARDRRAAAPVDFCSNDYLALSGDARLVRALQSAADRYGVGSGGSPLICGYSDAHRSLERSLCALTGRSRALLFSSGYLANLALITTLAADRRGAILMDKQCHASLIDAARLAAAPLWRYRHLQLSELERRLQGIGGDSARGDGNNSACGDGHDSAAAPTLIATESVFSMSGAVADLAALARLAARHAALLVVDDAHGFGVLGPRGAGAAAAQGVSERDAPLIMATLGKAAGVHGAFIAGDADWMELILQQGRGYMYSTALPAALAAAADRAVELLATEDWRRQRLRETIARFRRGARERGLNILPSETPIQALLLPGNENVLRAGRHLAERGIRVGVIRSPTVPRGAERLRVSLNAGHSERQLRRLLDALQRLPAAGPKAVGPSSP